MSSFDNIMLGIHAEAKKMAYEEIEKLLTLQKDYPALEKLAKLKEAEEFK